MVDYRPTPLDPAPVTGPHTNRLAKESGRSVFTTRVDSAVSSVVPYGHNMRSESEIINRRNRNRLYYLKQKEKKLKNIINKITLPGNISLLHNFILISRTFSLCHSPSVCLSLRTFIHTLLTFYLSLCLFLSLMCLCLFISDTQCLSIKTLSIWCNNFTR